MRKTLAVAHKEVRQIARDPLTWLMLLGLPAFMLVVFGYAINFDVEHVKLGVEDRDLSPQSRELVVSFIESGRFDLAGRLSGEAETLRALESGQVRLVLVVPEHFGRELEAGRASEVELLVDGTDAVTANTALGYAKAILAAVDARWRVEVLRRMGAEGASAAAIDVRPRVWYNPELASSNFLVPGLIGFILMITAVLSTALSLVREVERGTLEQLRVAPVATVELLLGKMLPYLVLSLVATGLILIAARLLFGIVVRGSYLDLFVITLLYLIAGFSWGLFISTLADSQAIAFQIGVMTSLLPTLLLSGFIFPIRNMPVALQVLSHVVPARYFLVALRGVVLKGSGLGPYADELRSLVLYIVIVLTLASVRFARRGAAA